MNELRYVYYHQKYWFPVTHLNIKSDFITTKTFFKFFSQQMRFFFWFFAKNEKGEELPSINSCKKYNIYQLSKCRYTTCSKNQRPYLSPYSPTRSKFRRRTNSFNLLFGGRISRIIIEFSTTIRRYYALAKMFCQQQTHV